MNRAWLVGMVVAAGGLSQGCVLHNNRVVGDNMTQSSDWYGELGVTGDLNRVEIKSPSDLTKLSVIGESNVVYVRPRVTLGKVEVFGGNNKIYLPQRLIIRSNIFGHGSEIIRLEPGQVVNLSGARPTIETEARSDARARWDRYDRNVSPAMPDRYIYTEPDDGRPGYSLEPSYDGGVGTSSYRADASSPAMPDGYRYAESNDSTYSGYALQPTYDTGYGGGDYAQPTMPVYANTGSAAGGTAAATPAPVTTGSDASGGGFGTNETYAATTYSSGGTFEAETATQAPTMAGGFSAGVNEGAATMTTADTGSRAATVTARPDPQGSYTYDSGSYAYEGGGYTTYSTPTQTAPQGSVGLNRPSEASASYSSYTQPATGAGQAIQPDPPGTYSNGSYSSVPTGATIAPLGSSGGQAGSIRYTPADSGSYSVPADGGMTYDDGRYTQPGYGQPGYGQPSINAPAATGGASTGLIPPQDYRGKPGEGIGTYTTPDGFQIRTQSSVVTQTGTSLPQSAPPQGDKPVVVEDYPY